MSKLHVNKAEPSILNPAHHPVHITVLYKAVTCQKGELPKWSGQREAELHSHGQVAAFETPWRKEWDKHWA